MKLTIRFALLTGLLFGRYSASAVEPTIQPTKYRLPTVQQRAKAAQQRSGTRKIVLPSLKAEVKAAKRQRDLDNPLYTGRIDYPLTANASEIAALHASYEPQFKEAWSWWQKLIVAEYLPKGLQTTLSAYVGNRRQDDLIGARYREQDMAIQIVDGRTITLVVSPADRTKYLVPNFEIREPFGGMRIPKGFHFDENLELVRDTQPLNIEEAKKYKALSNQQTNTHVEEHSHVRYRRKDRCEQPIFTHEFVVEAGSICGLVLAFYGLFRCVGLESDLAANATIMVMGAIYLAWFNHSLLRAENELI